MNTVVVEDLIFSAEQRISQAEIQHGFVHPELLSELQYLARLYFSACEFEKARDALWRILDIQQDQLGTEDKSLAETLYLLAQAYESEQKISLAEQLYLAALSILDKSEDRVMDLLDRVLIGLSLLNRKAA
ncbi:MAG: tetratricopeptide repeat protein [Candidatus Obscuribacterales bacterium]|nr:tetratricopeptide repeat protein [Candidatus Obscuribacterales bacterium]